tara:strand:+ start:62 stop:679 length:618 start_codon:yes stop_codon:yes gene_type:complete
MTPDFQSAAIPVVLDIIGLAKRASDGSTGPVEAERAALRASFETAAAICRGPSAEDWRLASYALASAVDELLIVDITWPGQAWWENHAMEVELFGTRKRATEFFTLAEKAASLPRGDALQVFVAAVIMGFQGTYRERPDSLETWLRMNRQRIKLSTDRPSVPSSGPEVAGAGPLTGHVLLLWSVFSSLLFTAIFIVTTWSVFYLL